MDNVRLAPSYTARVTPIPNMVAVAIVAHRVIHLIARKQMVVQDVRQVQHLVLLVQTFVSAKIHVLIVVLILVKQLVLVPVQV